MNGITSVTPTICRLMQVPEPAVSAEDGLAAVLQAAEALPGALPIARCLVFAPDAIGLGFYRRHRSLFEPVRRQAPVAVPLRSVVPPKTPVCYASMFTGALPEVHGIRRYEKPVLTCDTLFDSLVRAGKRVAIVAVAGCSIDLIFRQRAVDYFSEPYDQQVIERTLALLEAGEHDFIVAYNQGYDDAVHETTPESPEALLAVRNVIGNFAALAAAFDAHWRSHNRLIAFTPDHGGHVDPATGKGTHGEDIPEDMRVQHFYGLRTGYARA